MTPRQPIDVRQIENGNWLWSAEVNGNFRVGLETSEIGAHSSARAYLAWAEQQEPIVWTEPDRWLIGDA